MGYILTNTPIFQRIPLKINEIPISLTLTAAQTAAAPTKHRTPRRRIVLRRGSFMLHNGKSLDFKRFLGIEKVHRNSIKITVDLWQRTVILIEDAPPQRKLHPLRFICTPKILSVLPISALMQIDCRSISCGQTACP